MWLTPTLTEVSDYFATFETVPFFDEIMITLKRSGFAARRLFFSTIRDWLALGGLMSELVSELF